MSNDKEKLDENQPKNYNSLYNQNHSLIFSIPIAISLSFIQICFFFFGYFKNNPKKRNKTKGDDVE